MARYEANGIRVRRLKGLTIIFWDAKTIYVCIENGYTSVFQRWWAPRGSYNSWHNFYMRLLKNKHLTLGKCYELALEHDVVGQLSNRRPDLNGKDVTYI